MRSKRKAIQSAIFGIRLIFGLSICGCAMESDGNKSEEYEIGPVKLGLD